MVIFALSLVSDYIKLYHINIHCNTLICLIGGRTSSLFREWGQPNYDMPIFTFSLVFIYMIKNIR